ncbi:hypothetical protein Pan44_23910 [Caulifigura coniformis]|uniref:LysM domain-containing protein n=1 Tax=Caulifigura coniformis TaxID=2527983 RepID=A0A517SE20_9PLAN|nr:hypothetical protein [Caulifigura coniformis]QDT54358.1 hypothetical protein Pan44_23910 [Caulifigura coniformis]
MELHVPNRPIIMKSPHGLGSPHPLPPDYTPTNYSVAHRVKDGERWETLAKKYQVGVKTLIRFNFKTTIPDHVNWYLGLNVGCNKTTDDLNWAFSDSAQPGIVYIPGKSITFDEKEGENIVVCGDQLDVYERLLEVSKSIPGVVGDRIRKMMDLATFVGGDPKFKQLWFYDPNKILAYMQFHTDNPTRRSMTSSTNGAMPFGEDWRWYPFLSIVQYVVRMELRNYCIPDSEFRRLLEMYEDNMTKGWNTIQRTINATNGSSGAAYGALVEAFHEHVNALAGTKIHLYSIYR